jgi:hypothetical protein
MTNVLHPFQLLVIALAGWLNLSLLKTHLLRKSMTWVSFVFLVAVPVRAQNSWPEAF